MPSDPAPPGPAAPDFSGGRLRPARSLRVAAGLAGVWGALVAAVCVGLPELRAVMGGLGSLLLAVMIAGLVRIARRTPRGGGQLEVRDGDLHVEGRLTLRGRDLERAVVARDADGVNVSIQSRGGLTSIVDVGSEAHGRALVKALGLDAAQALSTFSFDSPIAARLPGWGYALFLASIIPLFFVPLALGALWLAVPFWLAWFASIVTGIVPVRLSVGLDGLLVRWLGRRELLRFDAIQGVTHDGEHLHLALLDGHHRALSVRWVGSPYQHSETGDRGFASQADYLDAVVARVQEAIAASRGEALPAAALGRRGREVDVWVGALRSTLRRGSNGFREAETVPEQLWGTVEDGGADPSARAAAAIALGPTLDDAERRRMHGVARVVVSPRLRVALEAAAADDDEAEREALTALEQERRLRA